MDVFARHVGAAASVRKRPRVENNAVLLGFLQNATNWMNLEALDLPHLCVNHVFCNVACRFAAQAQCFGRLRGCVAVPLRFTLHRLSFRGVFLGRRTCAFAESFVRARFGMKLVKIGRDYSCAAVPR